MQTQNVRGYEDLNILTVYVVFYQDGKLVLFIVLVILYKVPDICLASVEPCRKCNVCVSFVQVRCTRTTGVLFFCSILHIETSQARSTSNPRCFLEFPSVCIIRG